VFTLAASTGLSAAPGQQSQARGTFQCPETTAIRREAPPRQGADPLGRGPWYVNEDATIWALFQASIPDGYSEGFQASALMFPTIGCWEVRATAGRSTLTFVTAIR
jgi:hypothetical protein